MYFRLIERARHHGRLLLVAAVALVAAACVPPVLPPPPGGPTYATASAPADGFGGGTIYYPTDRPGPFGAVAIAPGFSASQDTMSWFGPLLAQNGFVAITIDTITPLDPPPSRGVQLLAALDHLVDNSTVSHLVDPDRLAVMGHSMGGGGALHAARLDPSLRAAIPLAPWDAGVGFAGVAVPTLVIACQDDTVAPRLVHADFFYASIVGPTTKAYLQFTGDHGCANANPRPQTEEAVLEWLARFVDDDTSVDACPPLEEGGEVISAQARNCPG